MHQPTVRVLEILNYIIKEEEPQRLADLSRKLSIPKSTILPILQTLCEHRYLFQNSRGEYTAGTALFSVGNHLKGKFPVMEYVSHKLKNLVELFGETCYFGVLDGGQVLYLDKADSIHPLRMLISSGKKLPAYSTGIGKALLSDMTKNDLEALYPEGLMPVTPNTITSFVKLADQMLQARADGYTEEIEESTEHIRCLAVPLRKNGKIMAALSIAIPVFRYDESMRADIVMQLKKTACDIEKVISDTDAVFI